MLYVGYNTVYTNNSWPVAGLPESRNVFSSRNYIGRAIALGRVSVSSGSVSSLKFDWNRQLHIIKLGRYIMFVPMYNIFYVYT